MESLPHGEYILKLQNRSTDSITQNWDVAVTYEARSINTLLAREHSRADTRLPSKLTIHFPADSPWGEFTQYYKLELGPPLVQFQATGSPTCSLKMLIKTFRAWGEADNGQRSKITDYGRDAFYCTLSNVPLGLVTGASENCETAQNTITFDNSSTHEHIIVSFPTRSSIINIEPASGNATTSTRIEHAGKLQDALRDHFLTVPKIAYTLAIINNRAPESNELRQLDLIPESFRIVCAASDRRSFLTLLIRTKAAGVNAVGNTRNLQEIWSGQWAILGTDPVPAGETASIIINKSFFVNRFLMRAAKKGAIAEGCTDARAVPLDKEPGFKLEFDWKTQFRSGKAESTALDFGYGNTRDRSIEVHDRTIDPNQGGEKLSMTFGQAKGTDKPATIDITWSYKDYIPWKDLDHSVCAPPPGVGGHSFSSIRKRKGIVVATQTLQKTVDVTDNLSDESFSVKFSINQNDWKLKTEAKPTDAGDKLMSIIGNIGIIPVEYNSEDVPDLAKILAQTYIEFDFNFGALRFFLTTNVLLPGRKVIDVNLSNGLRIPNDIVIVGKVVSTVDIDATDG